MNDETCENCGIGRGEFHCGDGNCNAFCCSDCFGKNYCSKHYDLEEEYE